MMKKLMTMAIMIILSSIVVMAENDSKNSSESTDSKVKSLVMKEMTYPTFASEQKIEGEVYVSFEFNKDGKINVIGTNSVSPELEKYVVEKLNTIKFSAEDIEVGHAYNIKITFMLY